MNGQDRNRILKMCRESQGEYAPVTQCPFQGFLLKRRFQEFSDLASVLASLDEAETRLCKNSRKIRAGLNRFGFIKRYNSRGFFYSLRHSLTLPRPYRVLATAIRLQEYEIPTPEVFGAITLRNNFLPNTAWLLTAPLSVAEQECHKLAAEFADGSPYLQFVSGATAMLVKMHSACVEHGDLNLRNLFCRKSAVGVYSGWGVLDLDGSEVFADELPISHRQRELARLISSFLRYVKTAAPERLPERKKVTGDFVRKYRELSGLDLGGKTLDQRVIYLTDRIRKDQR